VKLCSLSILSLLLLATVAHAQPPETEPETKKEKPRASETIVVTATRGERTVSTLPVSTSVITEEELESAPSTTVDDLLRTIPGVHLPLLGSVLHPPVASRISMHGLGGTRALVLVDGIPIHDPHYGTVQWQKVPLDTIRQVEVVRGGSAGAFGNYAMGGTINLRTRPVEESLIRLDGSFGNMSTQRQSLTIDQVVSPSLGVRASYNRFDTDGFQVLLNPGPFDFPAPSDSAVTALRADYRPSESMRGFVNGSWADVNVSNGIPFGRSEREIFDVGVGLQSAIGSDALWSAHLFHHEDEYRDSNSSTAPGGLSMYFSGLATIPSLATGGSLEWSKQRSGLLSFVSFGVDAQQISSNEHATTVNVAGTLTGEKTLHGRQRFAGVFGQASWQPSNRLEILTSVRLDHYSSQNGWEQVAGQARSEYPSSSSTQLDPRVSFRYSLSPRAILRGGAYRAFKAPTLRDLYRSTQNRTLVILANPDLGPETLLGAEVGVEWVFARSNFGLNLYRSDVEGLSARVEFAPGLAQPRNLGKIRSQGIEAMANVRLSRHWSADASYTYADSIIVDDPNPLVEGNLVPEVVPHIGSLTLRYVSDGGTTMSIRGRTLSRSYGEATNSAVQPAHQVVDLFLSHPLRSWIDAYVVAENVFDEVYYYALTSVTQRSGRPRSLSAGVRLNVSTPSLFN
jgi:outer membrane receptor protein involved in Fe transport